MVSKWLQLRRDFGQDDVGFDPDISWEDRVINSKSEEIIENLFDITNQRWPPIELFTICEKLGVHQVFKKTNLKSKFVLNTNDSEATITLHYNAELEEFANINEQNWNDYHRYFVAHKLGHLFLHPFNREYSRSTSNPSPDDPLEKHADAFARRLLIPEWMSSSAKSLALRTASNFDDYIDNYASWFRVPKELALDRLEELYHRYI